MLKESVARRRASEFQTAVRELRYAFRLFEPYSGTRKVTIFGSARIEPTVVEYRQAVEFAGRSRGGYMVIREPSRICRADTKGPGRRRFRANIRLPWEQSANPIIQKDKKLLTFKYFLPGS